MGQVGLTIIAIGGAVQYLGSPIFIVCAAAVETARVFTVHRGIQVSPREQPAQAIGLLLAFLLLWVVSSAFLAWVFIAQTGARDGALKGRNATIENARRDVAVAEQELSRITTSRLTDVIRQDIERVVSDTRSNGCDRLDGQFSREQCPRVFEWRKELADAQRRDALREKVGGLRPLSLTVAETFTPNPLVLWLHNQSGFSVERLDAAAVLACVLIIEGACVLMIWLGRADRVPHRGQPGSAGREVVVHVVEPVPNQVDATLTTPVNTGVLLVSLPELQRRILDIVAASGGVYNTSERELQNQLRHQRGEVRSALRRLADNGWLRIVTSGRGTRLELLREPPTSENVVTLQRR